MTVPTDPTPVRQVAAELFAAAARRRDLSTAGRLDCLAAQNALAVASTPVPTRFDALATDELIIHALHALAALTPREFADPSVIAAARHGRRALRGPS
jgi:hypothetical protein